MATTGTNRNAKNNGKSKGNTHHQPTTTTTTANNDTSSVKLQHRKEGIKHQNGTNANEATTANITTATTPSRAATTTSKSPSSLPNTSKLSTELYFIFCVTGIYIFYLIYGVYQEEINILKFGEERLVIGKYTAFLLTLQSLTNYLSARFYQYVVKEEPDKTPFREYGFSSLLIVISTFLSNTSIRYISYPTQVLAKSCKPIPVLLMGVFFYKRKYPLGKYFIVFIITLGVTLFMLPTPGSSKRKKSNNDLNPDIQWIGNLLLMISLALDGILGPFQENYVRKYRPSANSMMLNTNLWNTIFMLLITLLNGEMVEACLAVVRYPESILPISVFCLSSALGQHFIYMTTNRFGALTCTTVTTTRKFFTILVSIFWFSHPMSTLQWASIALVFSGLIFDVVQSYWKSK